MFSGWTELVNRTVCMCVCETVLMCWCRYGVGGCCWSNEQLAAD